MGGVARVYQARHNSAPAVAAKVSLTEGLSEWTARQLEEERTLWSAMRHPHIVRLLEVYLNPDACWTAYEYMDWDLFQYLAGRPGEPMEPDRVRSYSKQLLLALAFCHRRNILHRDVKPRNMLIRGDVRCAARAGCGRLAAHPLFSFWRRAL